MLDSAILYDPIYLGTGVDAELDLLGETDSYEIRVIDKTSGVEVQEAGAMVPTLRPVAYVRATELAARGVDPKDLDGGTLTMNGRSWRIEATQERPVPYGGAAKGEYGMILIEVEV